MIFSNPSYLTACLVPQYVKGKKRVRPAQGATEKSNSLSVIIEDENGDDDGANDSSDDESCCSDKETDHLYTRTASVQVAWRDDEAGAIAGRSDLLLFTPGEVAQAFSHFSYMATGRKRLICDIQGVYDEAKKLLQISDPVIHYYHRRKEHRRNVHGRTDLGQKGMDLFFKTHECSELCRLVTRGFRKAKRPYHDIGNDELAQRQKRIKL